MCSTAEEGEGWKEEVEWKEEGVEGVEGVEQGRGEGGRGWPLPTCSLMTVTKTGKLLLKGGNVAGQLLYTTL